MSELVSIVYKPQDVDEPVSGYTRVPLQEARLIEGYGIEGDGKGGVSGRNLNLMSAESVRGLAQEGFRTGPGQLGEQLIIGGLDVDALPGGTRLQIGETACVELTKPRTGCATFERHQDKLRQEAAGRMGMMAQVIVGGTIRVGDPVLVLD
ncbi:MAG TPA: MOSC domain-containing protein [Chthonomonadaceae bacterium]|nr:MOSC domain-containing protein [Chthonomonadaceae bacterium]